MFEEAEVKQLVSTWEEQYLFRETLINIILTGM